MKKILKDNGVSEDLIYIAMIESGFSGKIKSRARAVGFWQFIGGTGKHYGLKVNNLIDERYDPVRSTEAAAAYFKGLYNLFGSWYLAIASYNVGENRIKSMVMKNYTRNFWELAQRHQLPAETTQYIPKFLAARMIALEPEKYGFTGLDYQEPMVFDTVTAKDPVDLRILATKLKVDYEKLKDLNPAYKTQYAPLFGDEVAIRVPQGSLEEAKIAITMAAVKNKKSLDQVESSTSYVRYRVKKGETLDGIAQRFDVSVNDIIKLNRIRKGRIRSGQTLKIPNSGTASTTDSQSQLAVNRRSVASKQANRTYIVKKGDSLASIAQAKGVGLSMLLKENKLSRKSKILTGQKIVLPKSSKRGLKSGRFATL